MNLIPPNGWIKFGFPNGRWTCFMGWNARSHVSPLKSLGIRLLAFFLLTQFICYIAIDSFPPRAIAASILLAPLSMIVSGFILAIGGKHIVLWKTFLGIPYKRVIVRLDTPERIKIGFHWNRPDSNWLGIRERLELAQHGPTDYYSARDPQTFFGSPVTIPALGNAIKEELSRHLEIRKSRTPKASLRLLDQLKRAELWIEIEKTIKDGASLNVGNYFGRTPLHYAAQFYDSTTVPQQLIDRGASVDALDDFNETPLALAIRAGKLAIAQILLKETETIQQRNRYDQNLLHLAALAPAAIKPIIQLLLNEKLDGTAQDDLGNTPLHYIAGWIGENSEKVLVDLVKVAKNINVKNALGRTPLHFAAKSGLTKNVQFLISCGANPFLRDHEGNLASEIASIHQLRSQPSLFLK